MIKSADYFINASTTIFTIPCPGHGFFPLPGGRWILLHQEVIYMFLLCSNIYIYMIGNEICTSSFGAFCRSTFVTKVGVYYNILFVHAWLVILLALS